MHGKNHTNVCKKGSHTTDIEIQIVDNITWNIKVKFTLTIFISFVLKSFIKTDWPRNLTIWWCTFQKDI